MRDSFALQIAVDNNIPDFYGLILALAGGVGFVDPGSWGTPMYITHHEKEDLLLMQSLLSEIGVVSTLVYRHHHGYYYPISTGE